MTEDFDTIIKILYDDPIINKTYFKDAKQREDCVEGDRLLNAYIPKLDEEIFSNIPMLSPSGQEQWETDSLSAMCTQLVDKARIHGWAVVQFYKAEPAWRVFSELDKLKWLHDKNKHVIGVRVHYGTETQEDLLFGKNQCYLLKFKEGNHKDVFAYGDLDQAMWTVATTARETQTQLDMMARKPEFYHVVYGNPTPAQRSAIINALDDASILNAFAATKDAVEEIKIITRGSFTYLMDIIKEKTKHFAGLTRLPLAYYNGERTSGSGTGGSAENMVEIKIDRRKQHIFDLIKPILIQLYQERYSIALQTIDMDTNQVEEIQDEQTSQGINQQEESL